MTDLPWFPCFPSDALASCSEMDAETFGHYWRLLLFMYQRGGFAPYDEKKLRHILNCSVQRARKVRDALINEGRLTIEGDQITQKKVQKVLEKSSKTSEKLDKNLAKTPQVISDKPLKNKEAGLTILEPELEPDKKDTKVSQKAPPQFEEVWAAWPQPGRTRSSKKKVRAAYVEVLNAYDHTDVMRAVGMYLRSPDAKKGGGQFVPALDRWLQDERFTAWLEVADPKVAQPVGPVDLPDTMEGQFLADCREDGASERDLRAWLGRFSVDEINGRIALVTHDDDAALRNVFEKTLDRNGMDVMHALRAKRVREKST